MLHIHDHGIEISLAHRKMNAEDLQYITTFCCDDNPLLQDFIRDENIQSREHVPYVFVNRENNDIVGFYTINCSSIIVTESDITHQDKYKTIYPAIEISHFAIDKKYRHINLTHISSKYQTLSHLMFMCAMYEITQIAKNIINASYIILYSTPEAINFYKNCGMCEYDKRYMIDELPNLKSCVPMYKQIL